MQETESADTDTDTLIATAGESGIRRPIKRVTGDTIEEVLTANAHNNILPARYLKKDENGEPVESQEELFKRIADNIALAEAVYEAERLDSSVEVTPEQVKPDHPRRDELVQEAFIEDGTLSENFGGVPNITAVRSRDVTLEFENNERNEWVEWDDLSEEQQDALTVPLTEENVSKFAYDTIVPELSDDITEHVIDVRDEFQDMMESLSFMPNSPTIMNAGDELQQLSACFVNSPEDDLDDIHQTAKEAASVFQSGGGMGYAFSRLRGYGDTVGSTGGIASGPITFMETFDQMCETIAQGGARRGAQMGIMRVSHPDIIEFVHAKRKDVSLAHTLRLNDPKDRTHQTFRQALEEARELIDDDGQVPKHLRNAVEGHLSNFNISVGITDNFMEAVQNGEEFTFTNPRTEETHIATPETKEMYERYDLGEYVEVGEELSIPAEEVWERIVAGAHENGEPGVIYIDKVNDEHSFPVESTPGGKSSEYEILSTNPCGEQPLMEYEACNLGHINLSTVADVDAPDWRAWYDTHGDNYENITDAMGDFFQEAIDVEELNHRIEYGTRFLENVVTMSDFPVEKISETVADNRKIGLGIMGLAQLYIQLGIKYGTDAGNELARTLMTHINQESKSVSHELAKSRGPFANWGDSKYADPTEYKEWFEKQTGLEAENWEDGFEMRNHNTTTIAPTGTTSMVADTSGGCEPIYEVAYYKNVSQDVQGDEMLVEFDDYFLRMLKANDVDIEAVKKEAEQQMEDNEFEGVDGLDTVPDELGELFITTNDLTAKEHAGVQCACQDGVDSAISKTVNAPNDATLSDAQDAFEFVYEHGGKGVTYYRDGTRTKQVIQTQKDNVDFSDIDEMNDAEAAEVVAEEIEDQFGDFQSFFDHEAVRDKAIEAVENLTEDVVGSADEDEWSEGEIRNRPDVLHGITQRIDTGYGKLYVNINEGPHGEPFELFANIGNSGGFTNSFTESLGKVISTALRAGVDPEEIVDELRDTRSPKVDWDRGDRVDSIPDAIGLALERYLDGSLRGAQPRQQSLDEAGSNAASADTSNAGTSSDTSPPEHENGHSPREEAESMADDSDNEPVDDICPDCGSVSLYYSEGCKTCESCGWSEC